MDFEVSFFVDLPLFCSLSNKLKKKSSPPSLSPVPSVSSLALTILLAASFACLSPPYSFAANSEARSASGQVFTIVAAVTGVVPRPSLLRARSWEPRPAPPPPSSRMSSGPSAAKENPLSGESSCIEETPRSSKIAEALTVVDPDFDDGLFDDDGDGEEEETGGGGGAKTPSEASSSSETLPRASSTSLKLASRTRIAGGGGEGAGEASAGKASAAASESARRASSLARGSTSSPTTALSFFSLPRLLTSAEACPPAPRVPSTYRAIFSRAEKASRTSARRTGTWPGKLSGVSAGREVERDEADGDEADNEADDGEVSRALRV